jgi:hypothetical protein
MKRRKREENIDCWNAVVSWHLDKNQRGGNSLNSLKTKSEDGLENIFLRTSKIRKQRNCGI